MKKVCCVSVLVMCAAVVVAVAVLLGEARVAMALTCNPLELSPCAAAMTSQLPPSMACCGKLREQTPCLCGYLKDPNLRQYVDSPNAKRIASVCGIPTPTCS